MPLYEYQCQQCTNGFTELRRGSEMDTQIDCPECGSRETIRSISPFAVGGAVSEISSVSASSRSPFS